MTRESDNETPKLPFGLSAAPRPLDDWAWHQTNAEPLTDFSAYKPDTILIRLGHCPQEKKQIKRKICPDSYRSDARKNAGLMTPRCVISAPMPFFLLDPKPHQWEGKSKKEQKIDFLCIGSVLLY
ncbi:hypothetical protein AVEN_267823-1 [Araneus ventricosus]|uniref:Uncharacterized protein n=1 Tax=Araneus ventricosus TaxID=182803 RepID=A0A4Y2D5J6_ARAVE|nr:hypothetical protein AVEN_267823-1 [Araneus ventricosus]